MLRPHVAVVTGIDREHLDRFESFDHLRDAFVQFAESVGSDGACIMCVDDPEARRLASRSRAAVVTYGFDEAAEVRGRVVDVHGGGSRLRIEWGARSFAVDVPLLGRHNAANALAAVAAASRLGLEDDEIAAGIASFGGVHRRLERRGEVEGVLVFSDYAHHPTEVAAVLDALGRHVNRPIKAVFQPHRYSRTSRLAPELAEAFDGADEVFVTDVYAAGESPIADGEAARVVELTMARGRTLARHSGDIVATAAAVRSAAQPGDVVLIMGAGDVEGVASALLERVADGDADAC